MAINFKNVSANAGAIASELSTGRQLKTADILDADLTISAANMGRFPDPKTGEVKFYPILRFAEFPDAYYNGGQMVKENVVAWAIACGDNPETDMALPKLNEELKNQGGVPILLTLRQSKGSGQSYVALLMR